MQLLLCTPHPGCHIGIGGPPFDERRRHGMQHVVAARPDDEVRLPVSRRGLQVDDDAAGARRGALEHARAPLGLEGETGGRVNAQRRAEHNGQV